MFCEWRFRSLRRSSELETLTPMAYGPFSVLLTRRFPRSSLNPKLSSSFSQLLTLAKPFSTSQDPNPKPSSLSARLSFVFDQIDAIEKERSQKHETLQRIRAWRQSKYPQQQQQPPQNDTHSPQPKLEAISVHEENPNSEDVSVATEEPKTEVKKEVELVHPWPEWIQLMERLVHQNYFDHMRRDEDKLVNDLGFDSPEFADDSALDFTKDFKSVHAACLNFGKDRFDILRSLSRQDIQAMVGFGCPNVDKKVVFSAKLLRKHVHLDEGDVCSSCSLRNNCERAYLLTNKEDEARTIDIMRILLTYGFDPVNGSVTNKSLLKQKSVKTVVRKLLHEVVKLSSVPINPNLPPPVIKKAPPKVKQPPPPPKKRVGRDDVEMKKGDWLCPKCDFMNFAKNTICLQCDAKRPKRQLLPGEWECPECNFLNYRRNMVCFQCECKRPPDEFMENKMQDTKLSSKPRFDKKVSREEVSNAWNFDFDDDESDGADVAAFEYADAQAIDEDFPSGNQAQHGNHRAWKGDFEKNNRVQGDGEYSNPGLHKPGVGFDDFEDEDEDDIDSYELETQAQNSSARVEASENHFSEFKGSLELDDIEDKDDKMHAHTRTASRSVRSRSIGKSTSFYGSEDDELDFDKEQRSIHSNFKSSHASTAGQKRKGRGPTKKLSFGSDSDEDVGAGLYSDEDDDSDEAYSSRRNKGNKHDPSRSNNGSRHDSGRRNFTENRKSGSFGGRKVNKFSDDFDGPSRQSYRNGRGSKGNDRNRKRFDDFDESDGSPQQSYRNGRGSKGSDRNRKRFDDFDEFDGSPQQSYRNGRGSRGNDHNRRRFDDFDRSTSSYGNGRVQSFGNGGGSRGNDSNRPRFEGRERGTGQFNKYSMGDRDSGEFRNSRRVIER